VAQSVPVPLGSSILSSVQAPATSSLVVHSPVPPQDLSASLFTGGGLEKWTRSTHHADAAPPIGTILNRAAFPVLPTSQSAVVADST